MCATTSNCSRPIAGRRVRRRSPRIWKRRCATSSSAPPTPLSRASSCARPRPASSPTSGTRMLEKGLAVNTCDAKGGICAFNGTGNSSRHLVAAMGLVHPAVELLTDPPTTRAGQRRGRRPLRRLSSGRNAVSATWSARTWATRSACTAPPVARPICSCTWSARRFMPVCAVHHQGSRPHSSQPSGARSLQLLADRRPRYLRSRQAVLLDGDIRGMETLFYELVNNGVPMDLDAMTVTGTTWRRRLSDTTDIYRLMGVGDNPVILSTPRTARSPGSMCWTSNWFESAVVKISGMPERQVNHFDETIAFVLAISRPKKPPTTRLLDIHLLDRLRDERRLCRSRSARGLAPQSPAVRRRRRRCRMPLRPTTTFSTT